VQQWAIESDASSEWRWREVPCQESLFISQTTKVEAADLLAHGQCGLPTLSECFVAHRFILEVLQPHFNTLLARDMELCPVT